MSHLGFSIRALGAVGLIALVLCAPTLASHAAGRPLSAATLHADRVTLLAYFRASRSSASRHLLPPLLTVSADGGYANRAPNVTVYQDSGSIAVARALCRVTLAKTAAMKLPHATTVAVVDRNGDAIEQTFETRSGGSRCLQMDGMTP